MLVHEAAIIQGLIDEIAPNDILDCGSGSRADREIIQPHIAAAFRPYHVFWTDLKESIGVLPCDFTKPETLKDLPRCELVTACSLLEHVEDIPQALQAIVSLVEKWLIVSVPYKYPVHNCPIDNGYRPSPQDLAADLKALGLTIEKSFISGPEQFGNVTEASASIVLARK